jgi:RNA polymerase sigma factor (sigma-70 family)
LALLGTDQVVDGFLGTEAGFSRFYRRHAETLLIFFTRRCFDAQVALDLTAETFMEAFASRRTFRGSGDDEAGAWLYAIARRRLARYFEHGSVSRQLGRRLAGGVPVACDAELERIEELASLDELRAVLREQLMTIDPGQRQALWLRVVEEQPYSAVARALGISEPAARARVSRALRALSEPLAAADLVLEGGVGE